jgi:very-short-patch-repair endonuclease
MPRPTGADLGALSAILERQQFVISRSQALACGLPSEAIQHRIKTGGPWQRLLPGTYLARTGAPSVIQRDIAALVYAGPVSVITGRAALRGLGISGQQPDMIDVLIPAQEQRQSRGFVIIRRTIRMPELWAVEGERRYALAARAVGDAARVATSLGEARAVVAGAVQKRRCPMDLLVAELAAGPRNGSRLFRIALGEVAEGVRSVAEADFRELILRAGLPRPEFNARLRRADGSLLAVVDAWWAEARVAGEVDSREWHLSPADWERTMRRHNELAQCGVQVLHFSPRQIKAEPRAVVAAIAGALAQRGNRAQAG